MRAILTRKIIFSFLTTILFATAFSGCSKDNEESSEDPFYTGRLSGATSEALYGAWAIHKVQFNGVTENVPENSNDCGRDYLEFKPDGIYSEHYLTDTYDCSYDEASASWDLQDGILTISNGLNESEELVIQSLTSNQLVFRVRFDLDDDGKKEILIMTAYRYTPVDRDIYSYTFTRNTNPEHTNKLRFDWLAYQGNNPFGRYEIYRSNGVCSKANATLVSTITNKDQNFFIDEDPPAAERLCYYFKLYNSEGLLAESIMYEVETRTIEVPMVQLQKPEVSGNAIALTWEPYPGYYFSHYEIAVRNYTSSIGYYSQEYTIATIEDPNTLSYTDTAPPFIKDPVYAIYAVNIFGTRNIHQIEGGNIWEVLYSRPELLSFSTIEKTALSETSPVIFLYGRGEDGYSFKLCSYNYETSTTVACADVSPNIYTEVDMKVISTPFGEELIFPSGSEFLAYNASDLTYKYHLTNQNNINYQDFMVLDNGLWVLSDRNQIYTLTRNQETLTLVDQEFHFANMQSYTGYKLLDLNSGTVLLGHPNEPTSIRYTIDESNLLTLSQRDIPLRMLSLYYDPVNQLIINGGNKTLVDAASFEVANTYTYPAFTDGVSSDGSYVFGSKNDPQGSSSGLYPHEKNVYIYETSPGTDRAIATKGYPHFVFEGDNGKLMSISSGMLRDNLERQSQKNDIFIEEIGI